MVLAFMEPAWVELVVVFGRGVIIWLTLDISWCNCLPFLLGEKEIWSNGDCYDVDIVGFMVR